MADRYIFPYLSSSKLFSKYDFFKKFTEDVTVINKTEQIFVKEETSLSKISSQVSASVVNVLSIQQVSNKKMATIEPINGTGIIVTSDGLIMTYVSAIIPEFSEYKVLTSDGNYYDAQLLGTDTFSNLAFLKINASNLPVMPVGNSDDSKPGEKIIIIGNNMGYYANRYASGLLSNFNPVFNLSGKAISFSDKLEGVFQADVPFMKDYIGGPVIDYTGQVIGIVGSIEKNGNVEYFQIPSNKMKEVIERAISKDFTSNPSLGAYYLPLTKSQALINQLKTDRGALVYSSSGQQGLAVIAGSPAQKSGLMINDIIKSINGREIDLKNSLPDILYQYKKGDEVELTIVRNQQEIKIKVNL